MFVDRVNRNFPTIHPVTKFALRAIFSAMDVGMTILTALARITEQWSRVAFLASDLCVHTTEGIARLVVIEFGSVANGFPASCRVAFLAG